MVSLPTGQMPQPPSSSHQPEPTPTAIQRRPQFHSEYRWALPLPRAVLT